jgi:hypothetical protein
MAIPETCCAIGSAEMMTLFRRRSVSACLQQASAKPMSGLLVIRQQSGNNSLHSSNAPTVRPDGFLYTGRREA